MKNRVEELLKQITLEEKVSVLAGSDEIWRINADHLAEKAGGHPIASGDNVTVPAQSVTPYILAHVKTTRVTVRCRLPNRVH
jgi:hypothetical protein